MDIKIGDYVSRNSHDNDTIFKVIKITNNIAYLKGVYVRLLADSDYSDLKKEELQDDDFDVEIDEKDLRGDYFYLPGKVLHIDADEEYLDKCLKFYKKFGVMAIGKKISEGQIYLQLPELLQSHKPDVIVLTGHDAYYSKKGDKENLDNYKNSKYFIRAIKAARKYEKSQEKLVIIAGACQSNYDELIKAGANFASSPKRINIHALDPAIIAVSVALTKRNNQINLKDILNKTKYGPDGMGGIITNGLMYVGYPR